MRFRLTASATAAVLAACAGAAGLALAQSAAPLGAAAPAPHRAAPYLTVAAEPDAYLFLAPPPAPDSVAEAGDRAAFEAGRALQGQPRWALATRDVVQTPQSLLSDFGCALGLALDERSAPALMRLLSRTLRDSGQTVDKAKDQFRRPRPFKRWAGAICQERTPALLDSFSYPSGHTTVSWTYALILAELAPDRAAAILARGRAYGESRVVCGVHYVSDVEAGRTTASALFAALQAEPAFRADLDAARAELAGLRTAGAIQAPPAAQCAVQDEAGRTTPWAAR